MTASKRGLGRGLDVLLNDIYAKAAVATPERAPASNPPRTQRAETSELLREAEALKTLLSDIETWVDDFPPE